MTQNDIEQIAHLDFEPVEKPGCEGVKSNTAQKNPLFEIKDNKGTCPNEAKVIGLVACCGIPETLCMDCYTFSARAAATFFKETGGWIHNDCGQLMHQARYYSHTEWL